MTRRYSLFIISISGLLCHSLIAQPPGPWNSGLMIAFSDDGTTFATPRLFQDSAGVPSIATDSRGNLIATFQWFPAPIGGPHWDSVAVNLVRWRSDMERSDAHHRLRNAAGLPAPLRPRHHHNRRSTVSSLFLVWPQTSAWNEGPDQYLLGHIIRWCQLCLRSGCPFR